MSTVSTHVLDTAAGRPASGVQVRLEVIRDDEVTVLANAVTADDGRVASLGPDDLEAGTYRLVFDTASYNSGFFPEVGITFTVADPAQHYHVPLLLSPYSYSTYRGS